MKAYMDPDSPGNGPKYHSDLACAVEGCTEPAGTAWSPYWCFRHNVERIDRMMQQLDKIANRANEWPYNPQGERSV